jgi:hypothetical protein
MPTSYRYTAGSDARLENETVAGAPVGEQVTIVDGAASGDLRNAGREIAG